MICGCISGCEYKIVRSVGPKETIVHFFLVGHNAYYAHMCLI